MDAKTVLDYAIFQLTPTRTRYELFVIAKGAVDRITSGLLKPFLSHIEAAEEQLARGGYSIKLEHPVRSEAPWFTKGTIERFVRFVSSPEVIERGSIIETELLQLEETIRLQTSTFTRAEDSQLDGSSSIYLIGENNFSSSQKIKALKKKRQDCAENDSAVSQNSKKQLLRALEARHTVLQKEQGMAFARAAAAGFDLLSLLQLIMFSECFGASRLREACCNFVGLCKKQQIVGFCVGDLSSIDDDISWSRSNLACLRILKSMEKDLQAGGKKNLNGANYSMMGVAPVVQNGEIFYEANGFESPRTKLCSEKQKPTFDAKSTSPSLPVEWLNGGATYQGWPAIYSDMNCTTAAVNGYHCRYSPGSQQSCTTLSDMSPLATGLVCYSMGAANQPHKAIYQTYDSQNMNAFPSLKKLQVRHRVKKKSRSARDGKCEEPVKYGDEKVNSCEITDSVSSGTSESSKGASVGFQDDHCLGDSANDSLQQRFVRRSDYDVSACPIEETKVFGKQAKHCLDANGSLYTLQMSEASSNVQNYVTEVSNDRSLLLLEQGRDDAFGSRSKKRLDFQDSETQCKQSIAGFLGPRDDSLHAYESPNSFEHRMDTTIESKLQANQIYHKMSKQALKVNSEIPARNGLEDLQLLPKERIQSFPRNSSDVLNIDVELCGSAEDPKHLKSKERVQGLEPSQDRVKDFLSQYNEKREAKLRAHANGLKKAERDGKSKAMKEDLEKNKSDLVKSTRSERSRLQSEAQMRAEKLRMYKTDLLKAKKEKEEEERCRLEDLKAQRQSRIAARSNTIGVGNGGLSNQKRQASLQASSLKPSKPTTSASRPSALPKTRASVRDVQVSTSSSKIAKQHVREHASRNTTKGTVSQLRSAMPSDLRQTGKTVPRSSKSVKSERLQSPEKTTSPVKLNRVPVAFNKAMQWGRQSDLKRDCDSTTAGKKQGVLSISQSRFLSTGTQRKPLSKETTSLVGETKHAGRPYLKKGSGTKTSISWPHKTSSASPLRVGSTDSRSRGTTNTQASTLGPKQRNGSRASSGETRVSISKGVISMRASSVSTPSLVQSRSARASSNPKLGSSSTKATPVHTTSGSKCRIPPWATGYSTATSNQENNFWHSERLPHKVSEDESVLLRPAFFEASSMMNGASNDLSIEVVSSSDRRVTASNVNCLEPQSTEVLSSRQMSKGLNMKSSFGHMNTEILGKRMQTGHGAGEGKRLPGEALYSQSSGQCISGSSSSGLKKSSQATTALPPLPFLSMAMDKRAQRNWH